MKTHLCYIIFLLFAVSCSSAPFIRTNKGVVVFVDNQESETKAVRLQIINDSILHVTVSPLCEIYEEVNLIDIADYTLFSSDWGITQMEEHVILETKALKVSVSTLTGKIKFTDLNGNTLLSESSKSFTKKQLAEKEAYTIHQVFNSPNDETFYGLGQHQSDEFNYKGKNEDLFQYNTKVSIPFVLSSNNYGILWNNYSYTKYGDEREYSNIDQFVLYNSEGKKGALTATYLPKKEDANAEVRLETKIDYENSSTVSQLPRRSNYYKDVTWDGYIESKESGTYRFKLSYAGYIKVYVDNELIVPERWRASYIPNNGYKFVVDMKAGEKRKIKINWQPDGNSFIGLKALSPRSEKMQNNLSFWSEVADNIDYYFIKGSSADDVIKGYRTITGKAPMMPKWALGFWQSREKYTTQYETLDVVKEYRKRNIPLDNIVQDWHFWSDGQWGSHNFDSVRFPRPEAMIDTIHAQNAKIMITVWPKFYRGLEHYNQFAEKGYLYSTPIDEEVVDFKNFKQSFYDAYNKDARELYWTQINDKLYSKGIDAWWLDASEPSILDNISVERQKELMNPTSLGSSSQYFTPYPMLNSKGVYEGQRATNPNQRVYILTRSGFAGSQHYASAIWSGDVASRWEDLKSQITAGLNISLSGIPYWTTDIGGFCVETRFEKAKEGSKEMEEWRELNTRWFQFGAFCPIFRSHGKFPFREIYNIAPENHAAYKSMVYYNKLRYSLMPYIYSLTGMVYHTDYTIMRALIMDFGGDYRARDIGDQFMFGPSIMVCPVYEYGARTRNVYFPKNSNWHHYNTAQYILGGQTLAIDAPYERIPLFIKAGSIIPIGVDVQHTQEPQTDNITLTVYMGANGEFTLYEDEETNYNYETGQFSTIAMQYNDEKEELTLHKRKGEFDSMINSRTFNIAWKTVDGKTITSAPVTYTGDQIKITQ